MNYRHAFHAGNFADVLKHVVLMRILAHLLRKDTAIRVIDTHAGAGLYDLGSDAAQRTGEWIDGIGRLKDDPLEPAAEALLAEYRAAITAIAGDRKLYPGSPAFIRHVLRPQDRASFNELHPETMHQLRRALGRDERVVSNQLDGYLAWKAQVPPPERRGLVLVDPPFERDDEFDRMADGFATMARKWATGIAMLWYPVKNQRRVSLFEAALAESAFPRILLVELHVCEPEAEGPLAACGLAIANPPWKLDEELLVLLPALSARLGREGTARWRVDWLRNAAP
jgi:23S rRNA (adenine2030-N6)-methyltransferase